jgi:thymidylate synthase
MKQYLDLLHHVLNNGTMEETRAVLKSTGEHVRALSCFGTMTRYDLTKGFPAVTTKKLFLEGVIHELIWFLRGDTNIKYLLDHGVHIWDDWADENGNLGPIYGEQWRRWTNISIQPERIFEPGIPSIETRFELVEPKENSKLSLLGNVFENKYGKYKVIDYNSNKRCKTFDVQFLSTGYVAKGVGFTQIKEGVVRDRFYPSILGVGCIGHQVPKDIYEILYKNYGGKGVHVCNRWLVFSQFVEDAQKIENWFLKKEFPDKYTIDKDFYCSNRYGPDTCKWSNREEQALNKEDYIYFKATNPDGFSIYRLGATKFAREFGLSGSQVRFEVVKNGKYKGWKFERLENSGGIPRARITDQIHYLISEIKNNPTSRRLVLNSWNPDVVNLLKLPPCHLMCLFNVVDGKLSCMLIQRSGDLFLGVPFNVASYALLTHIIAHLCGLEVGELVHSITDAHIYENHIDQVRTQLERNPFPLPKLEISKDFTDVDNIRREFFKIAGYKSHDHLKGEVAV